LVAFPWKTARIGSGKEAKPMALSQGVLAEQLDVSRQSVSKWEMGQAAPELVKIIKLADPFGIVIHLRQHRIIVKTEQGGQPRGGNHGKVAEKEGLRAY